MPEDKIIFHNLVRWKGAKKADLKFVESKTEIEVATPPQFGGYEGITNPEDLFVASVNACFMTTFLAFADKMGIELMSYESEAEGVLEKVGDARVFTKVVLKPRIKAKAAVEVIRQVIDMVKQRSIVVNSVKSEVVVDAEVNGE
jgi:organic hydroperoxide reductase OsmC/OhrA